MRAQQLFFSLISLLLSFFFMLLGLLFLLIPQVEEKMVRWFHHTHFVTWLGTGILGFGLLLLAIFYGLSRRRYLLIKMGGSPLLQVADPAIASTIETTLGIPCDVIVRRKGKIEILVDLPYLNVEERGAKLEELERDLSQVLADTFAYDQEFVLNVQFQSP